MMTSHRLVLFLPLVIISFFIVNIFRVISKKITQIGIDINPHTKHVHIFYIILMISMALFGLLFSQIGFFMKNLSDYYEGFLFSGDDMLSVILNIFMDYIGKTGIILIFGVFGFFWVIMKKRKEFGEYFVIINTLFLIPFMTIEDYTPEMFIIFLSLLIGFGLIKIVDIVKDNKNVVLLLSTVCLVVVVFSLFMIDHDQVFNSGMSDQTYELTSYLKDNSNGSAVAASGILGAQISAYAGIHSLPYGGAYSATYSPEQLIFGSVERNLSTRSLPFSQIFNERLFYYPVKAPSAVKDWVQVIQFANAEMIMKYKIRYIVYHENKENEFWYWGWQFSRLLTYKDDLSGKRIYTNGRESVWLI